jgi:hypothetical protein
MIWVGFETTIPAFERAKTVHALHREATVIGKPDYWCTICKECGKTKLHFLALLRYWCNTLKWRDTFIQSLDVNINLVALVVLETLVPISKLR